MNLKDAMLSALRSYRTVGVAYVMGSGFVVTDVNDGKAGEGSIDFIVAENGRMPTPTSLEASAMVADEFYEALGYSDGVSVDDVPEFLRPRKVIKPIRGKIEQLTKKPLRVKARPGKLK